MRLQISTATTCLPSLLTISKEPRTRPSIFDIRAPVRRPQNIRPQVPLLPHPLIQRHANPAAAGCCRQHIVHIAEQTKAQQKFSPNIQSSPGRPLTPLPNNRHRASRLWLQPLHSENFPSRFENITCMQKARMGTNGASFHVSTIVVS